MIMLVTQVYRHTIEVEYTDSSGTHTRKHHYCSTEFMDSQEFNTNLQIISSSLDCKSEILKLTVEKLDGLK